MGDAIEVSWGGQSKTFPSGTTITLGRSGDCAVTTANPNVSRNHGELREVDGRWTFADLGSSQGTFVAGERIATQAVVRGLEISLGQPGIGEIVRVVVIPDEPPSEDANATMLGTPAQRSRVSEQPETPPAQSMPLPPPLAAAPVGAAPVAVPFAGAPLSSKDARATAKAAKAYAKAQRPLWKKKRFLLSVALVLLIVIIAAANAGKKSDNATSSAAGGGAPSARPGSASAGYKVGDTAKTSDFSVTVYGFKDPQPPADALDTPTAGDHFVSVDVQVMNTSSDQQAFSSLLGFHLLDAQHHQYDEDLTGGGLSPGPPDGQIAAGQSIRGFAVFEVPDGTSGLEFRAQGSITASGDVFSL